MPEGSAPERRSPVARVNKNTGKDTFVDAFYVEGRKYGEGAWNVPPPIGIRERGVQKNVTKKEVKTPPPLPPTPRSIKAEPKVAAVEVEPIQLDADDLQDDVEPIPAEPPQEKGIVLRRPEPVASRPYIGSHTSAEIPVRSKRVKEKVPQQPVDPRMFERLSAGEIRGKQKTEQDAWVREATRAPQVQRKPAGPEKSHASVAIEGLGRELDGLMDLAKRYRTIYGGEIYDEAKEGTQHRIADSFMGRIGRWFTRDDGKNKAREEAASSGFGSAKAFQGEWKKQLQALDARAATFKGNTLVIRDRIHEILKIPIQEKAQAAWNALYENLLDLTVLAPVTAVVDTYKEAKTTARKQEQTRAEAMARGTTQLAERILTSQGFQKTRNAVAVEARKNVEDIEMGDVLEFLYTTDHGQRILELEQAQKDENALVSAMGEASQALYKKIHRTEAAIRATGEMAAERGFSEVLTAVEELKGEVDQAASPDERAILTKKWEELHERATRYYEQKGRKRLIEDASEELGKVEAVALSLLARSETDPAAQAEIKDNLVDNRELFLEDVEALLSESKPASIKEVKSKISTLLKETREGLMPFCLDQAKEAAERAQVDEQKVKYVHDRIAFIVGGKDGPVGPMQRAAMLREAQLLQKTGALDTMHLEAEVLIDMADVQKQREALKAGSEKKDPLPLVDAVDRLMKESYALDHSGKAEAYLLEGGIQWDKIIFGEQLGEELGKKIFENTLEQAGDWRAAVRELHQTKAAWIVGRKLLIHPDRRLPELVIKKKITKELPDAYKSQTNEIFAALQEGMREGA